MWHMLPYTSFFDPWLWLTIGIVFLVAELLVSGYFLLSFGISAVLIAAGNAVIPNSYLTGSTVEVAMLFAVWSALSLLMWVLMAKVLAQTKPDTDINKFSSRVEGTDPTQGMPEREKVWENHTK